MIGCRSERLEAWLEGDIDPAAETSVAAHVARCDACAREVAWLRTERELFAARERADRSRPPEFTTVLARVAAGDAPARRRAEPAPPREHQALALGLCAAAALLCVLLPQRGRESLTPAPDGPPRAAAIASAEGATVGPWQRADALSPFDAPSAGEPDEASCSSGEAPLQASFAPRGAVAEPPSPSREDEARECACDPELTPGCGSRSASEAALDRLDLTCHGTQL